MKYSSVSKPIIWTIGGGKGGVGKSFLACNLGICLSGLGKKVLLVDADFGAANLHTFLGTEHTRSSFSSFLKGTLFDLQHTISKTPVKNLDLISGAKDALNMADINGNKLSGLYEALKKLRYDYILLDIGPGTSSNMLDLFLMANRGILVTSPEPTSIENTYRFLKCLFFYKMKKIMASQGEGKVKDTLKKIFSSNGAPKVKTVGDVFMKLKNSNNSRGQILNAIMENTHVSIVINQTKKPEDKDIGFLIKRICYDYFGFEIGYPGYICYDDFAGDSIRYSQPLIIHYKHSPAAKAIAMITEQLLEQEKRKLPQQVNIVKT